jgi:putative pyruvate formate lyase activating enzyme
MRQNPLYMKLYQSGRLQELADELMAIYKDCTLCPHMCHANRYQKNDSFCQAPPEAVISAAYAHKGNEAVISGYAGSGNIFLTYCNSRCVFCQNDDISQGHSGQPVSVEQLAQIYLNLQEEGCHNVDFVSPQHFVPHIVAALQLAIEKGFRLPLVYNSNGYESLAILKKVAGVFDIFLPDFKFADAETAERLTGMKSYPEVTAKAIAEMFRQVGPLQVDEENIAWRGLIVRHLVLPNDAGGTAEVLQRIAAIDTDITLNLMAQYHPAYQANNFPEINRRISKDEYSNSIQAAEDNGLSNIWTQILL